MATQTNAPWGLDRIDSRDGLDSAYSYEMDGSDVDIYVLDTSVVVHSDYASRFKGCVDYTGEGCYVATPNIHGTHVGKNSQVTLSCHYEIKIICLTFVV